MKSPKCPVCGTELETHEYLDDDTTDTPVKWESAYYCEECDCYHPESDFE